MDILLSVIQMLSKEDRNNNKGEFPLTDFEGQARNDRAIEEGKGRGLDWAKHNEH